MAELGHGIGPWQGWDWVGGAMGQDHVTGPWQGWGMGQGRVVPWDRAGQVRFCILVVPWCGVAPYMGHGALCNAATALLDATTTS